MLKKIVQQVMAPRHLWRPDAAQYARAAKKTFKIPDGFEELSELYATQLLRSFSLGLVSIFVPVFLYRLGYDIQTIFWFYVLWFAFRPFLDIVTGLLIGRFGPKHTLAFGVFMQIFHLSLLLTLNRYDWPLFLVAISGGWAFGMFILAFEVGFSKVKHSEHGGKELSYATILERLGAVIGPLLGGLVGAAFGLRYTIGLAITVLLGSLIPIFLSQEPTKIRQKLHFESFPLKKHRRDLFAGAMLTLENAIAIILWPLFIGVFIFTDNTYAKLGVATAVGTFVAVLCSHLVGKLTDEGRGRSLLRVSTYFSAIVHLSRPFAHSFGAVTAVNVASDVLAMGYRIPFVKAMYDRADSLPGYRIVYLCYMSAFNTAARFVFWLVLWIASQFIDPLTVIYWGFVAASLFALGITVERFPSLGKNRSRG